MKRTGTAIQLLLLSIFTAGCSTSHTQERQQHSEGSYCMRGGSASNYSCEAAMAGHTIPMHPQTVDEKWMYETLEDIKDWLKEEKQKREISDKSP